MEIIELDAESLSKRTIRYTYSSENYCNLVIKKDSNRWTADPFLKEFAAAFVKEEFYNLLEPSRSFH
ncbi:MAG: hypothetical protein ACP5FY_11605 [Kosmotogaceae bacterium]